MAEKVKELMREHRESHKFALPGWGKRDVVLRKIFEEPVFPHRDTSENLIEEGGNEEEERMYPGNRQVNAREEADVWSGYVEHRQDGGEWLEEMVRRRAEEASRNEY